MDLKTIKLIIWDLDDTLWTGILSEENVSLKPEMWQFIEDTLDCGIVHSICSKNDFESTKSHMQEEGLWDKFVFPSINWSAKGQRIKETISAMALRPVNVLFVDDNPQNLKEVEYFNSGIQTALPTSEEFLDLLKQASEAPKTDTQRKRLDRYRILEEKNAVKSSFTNNEEFLKSCNIVVEMVSGNDCLAQAERIHELAMRSNQLNFTKWRQDLDGFKALISDDSVNCGYVQVHDNFGDYGIVGFYAIKDGKAFHFFFSCRILGMAVEQYVYAKTGYPRVEVVGDVVSELSNAPAPLWINQVNPQENKHEGQRELSGKILLKGPCDLGTIFTFIRDTKNIDTEFTYINKHGIQIEGTSHSTSVVSAFKHSEKEKQESLKDVWWLDAGMLQTNLQNKQYDCVVFSLLATANLGIYRNKQYGTHIALCERCYDLTNSDNWDAYINGEIFTSNIKFTRESLEIFANEFEFVYAKPESFVTDDLDVIYNHCPNTNFILLLGSETPFLNNKLKNYEDRHNTHAAMNRAVEKWAADKNNVQLIHLGDYVVSQEDYADSINHFSKRVYFEMTKDLLAAINDKLGNSAEIRYGGGVVLSNATLPQKSSHIAHETRRKVCKEVA